jgi:GNAT superfamily N-acetyltransferase
MTIGYYEISTDKIDIIKPLWEQLNYHHMGISNNFKDSFLTRTFDDRKRSLIVGNKKLKIIISEDVELSKIIGYSIFSIDGVNGEVDSIFVCEEYREKNIGQEFMKKALDWFDRNKIVNIFVNVLYENVHALKFYEKFGFVPRTYTLQLAHT